MRSTRQLTGAEILLIALLAILAGCGQISATRTSTPTTTPPLASPTVTALPPLPSAAGITELDVLRVSPYPEDRVAPFAAHSTDSKKIRPFYAYLFTFPPFDPSKIFCPFGGAATYNLTFKFMYAPPVIMYFLDGCVRIRLPDPYGERAIPDPQIFVRQLADTLGVPASAIAYAGNVLDTAPPGGPFAPTPTPTPNR